jgi:hypothetical protein
MALAMVLANGGDNNSNTNVGESGVALAHGITNAGKTHTSFRPVGGLCEIGDQVPDRVGP